MSDLKLKHFTILKQHISSTFLKNNAAPAKIEDWKGETITAFQEDIFEKTKATISEKWFYTYFKNSSDKLPRIDMLNILCVYVGYKNWNDFIEKNKITTKSLSNKKNKSTYITVLSLFIIGFLLLVSYIFNSSNHLFEFCFFNNDTHQPITSAPINITILQKNESPIYLKTDSTGCFSYKTKEKNIVFIVDAPYHKTDTISRSIKNNENSIIKLKTDDYALMLHYYSTSNKSDWIKRKQQLHKLFDQNAMIYRIFKNSIGVEQYSKEDFINQLTIPTSTLKNIAIIDKVYKNGKIVKLKFMVK